MSLLIPTGNVSSADGTSGCACEKTISIRRSRTTSVTNRSHERPGLIDAIWLKRNAPMAAFEVETTTSAHSGLRRMSDLVELVPALNIDLYIVAPQEREDKVLREMARPTFRRIGLPDICRFISVEDLQKLAQKVAGLGGDQSIHHPNDSSGTSRSTGDWLGLTRIPKNHRISSRCRAAKPVLPQPVRRKAA